MPFRSLGNVPVEARIVDQHHGIDFVLLKVILGPVDQAKKEPELLEHLPNKHHCHLSQIVVNVTTCRRHLRPTKTYALDRVIVFFEPTHQIGAV